MNHQRFKILSADAEREGATTSSALTKDGIRVRSLMKDTDTTHTHAQTPVNTATYTPTRQGRQVATILVIGVVLLAAALLYALRSNGVNNLLGGKDSTPASPSLSENPGMVTENPTDGAIMSQQVVAPDSTLHNAAAEPVQNTASTQPQSAVGNPLPGTSGAPVVLPPDPSAPAVSNLHDAGAATGQPLHGVEGTTPTEDQNVAAATNAPQAQAADNSTEAVASKPVSVKPIGLAAATPSSPTAYSVQVCATADKAEAERIAQQLRSQRIARVAVENINRDGKQVYRVRFGSFITDEAARQAAERAGQDGAWIVKKNPPESPSPKKTDPAAKKDDPKQKTPPVKKTVTGTKTSAPILPMTIAKSPLVRKNPGTLPAAAIKGSAAHPTAAKPVAATTAARKTPEGTTGVPAMIKKPASTATAPRNISSKGIVRNVPKREIAVVMSSAKSPAAHVPAKKPVTPKAPLKHQAP